MKNLFLLLLGIITLNSCLHKEPPITKTYELSDDMIGYFVDYKVGTKWIYQDTMDKTIYDTVELISKKNMDVDNGSGALFKGFELYYQPKKSKDFKVLVSAGKNNSCYVKVDPLVTASGVVVFENYDGIWYSGITYYDTLEITGNKYYNVIQSKSTNMYHYLMTISKSTGFVFFMRYGDKGHGITSCFKLIEIKKP